MFIIACALSIVAVGLIFANGLNSAQVVRSRPIRVLVIVGSIAAALLSAALIFETLAPAEAQEGGVLKAAKDEVSLGDVAGGILSVRCEALEGVKETGGPLAVNLVTIGADGKLMTTTRFQFGSNQSETDPRPEHMAANIRLGALGSDTKVQLTKVNPSDKVAIHVAYHPNRFPVEIALILLGILALLAGAYEGAAPAGWRRTFLTTCIVGVAAFVWLLKDGLTAEDSVWTMWIRLAFGIGVGAVAGTVLPAIMGAILPELQGEQRTSPTPSAPE